MKKSLIAVAVASAFAAPSAFAEVTISGAVNIGIALINSSDATGTTDTGQNRTSLATNYTNLNVASVDDIGNGNKVILNIQFDLGLAGTGSFNNRNSYLGLEGSWGSFKMGTNENVYERWMYESDPLDGAMGIGGNIQMLGQTGLGGANGTHDWFVKGNGENVCDPLGITGNPFGGGNCETGSFWRRTNNTIWYNSPNWNGFTFEIDQTLSAAKTTVAGTTVDPMVTSLGGQWKPDGMPFFVNVGYEKHKDSTIDFSFVPGGAAGTFDATGIQFGGGYTFQQFTVYARYEQLEWKPTTGTGKLERDHFWLAGKMTMPTGYAAVEFGKASKLKVSGSDLNDSDANMISGGYFHNLSKQSQMYVVGTRITNKDNAAYAIDAGSGSTGGAGSDHTAFTVGLKHVF